MKKIYTTTDLVEAHIIKGILESNNIEVKIEDDQLLTLAGATAYAESVMASIWILDDNQYNKAYKILEIYEKNLKKDNTIQATWHCSNCQEELEEVFTECWNCGRSRG